MSLEEAGQIDSIPTPNIEVESSFEAFVPEEFRTDPFGYFDKNGRNIKSGEIEYDEAGVVSEDPTATKDLPVWENGEEKLHTVGKKVNTIKSQVGKSGDPFYEYQVMEIAKEFNLPAPEPIAKVSRDSEHLIVMKKVEGIRWTDEGMKPIHEAGLSDDEKKDLLTQAEQMMDVLRQKYERIGLKRNWKLKDMIFDVDIPNRKVLKIVPTDWERTKIDEKVLSSERLLLGRSWDLPSDESLVDRAEERLLEELVLVGYDADSDDVDGMTVAFREALVNAMDHGNKFDPEKKYMWILK